MSLPSSNWAAQAFQKVFANASRPGKIQTRRRRTRRPAQQISLESLEPRQMLSVNPASSGSGASSATDTSNIAAFVSQNSIGILAVVPGSPTSVVATSGNTSLAVTWAAPASTGGSAITEYLVKYSSNGGVAGSWTRYRPGSPITATSCTVTGLTNGTPSVIKVIAKNAIGISPPSASSAPAKPAATPAAAAAAAVPSAPRSVVAVRGNASLAVTWAAPASDGGSNITDYLVKYSANNGATWTNFTDPVSTATSCTVTGLMTGTSYMIKVVAKNAVGISPPSANSAPAALLVALSMVTVGNPGNAADSAPPGWGISAYGAVSYSYQIGKYDVTGAQYTAFLNAVGSTDTYGLYNASMGTDTNVAQISRSGTTGTYTYAVVNSTGSRPITYVSWFDSARFSNWMSNGQPSGAQNSTTTENGAYNVNGATSYPANAVVANATNPNTSLAPTYRIPLENEWYKAAYYSPNCSDSGFGGYYLYATQSNSAPGTTIGSSANQANYNNAIGHSTDVGAFSGSGSFYGTFDQTGNVGQWNDVGNGPAGSDSSTRGLRGGGWDSFNLISQLGNYNRPNRSYTHLAYESSTIGFRLASPSSSSVLMSMVTVGNPGNSADTNTGSLYGAVSYSYQIGKYDVTGAQYTAFLNAVGSTDTYGLYNASMGTNPNVAQISRSVSSGSYTYAVLNGTGSRPITYVSWFDCARFSNWMSNGQPSGAQTSTTTENGAYNLNGAISGNAVVANATNPNTSLAPTYRIPLENEWYKAAYYFDDLRSFDGLGGYDVYATQSNSAPGTTIGSSANQANYKSAIGHSTDVGSFAGSGSFYGTFDQTGNVFQWNDLDGTAGSSRGFRGGSWISNDTPNYLVSSSNRYNGYGPSYESRVIGFRLASPVWRVVNA